MSDRLVLTFTGLLLIMIIGMLTTTFELLIYPYVLVIGILLLTGMRKLIKSNRVFLWIPITATILFILLFLGATVTNGDTKIIFGIPISTAFYFLGIWPLCVVFSLIYAWAFTKQEKIITSVDRQSVTPK